MKPYWTGVFPAVTTQLKKDRSLDLPATARHLEVLIGSGVGGLVMCGSNQQLEPQEKRAVVRDTHVHFVQYIKLCEQETGLGAEWVRAPRLALRGEERRRVLKIIRDAIRKRPAVAKGSSAGSAGNAHR